MKTGIVIFGHGSSVPSANDAVRRVAAEAAEAGGFELHETAFLDVSPLLGEAVASLVKRGAERLLVVPYFLTLGIHLQRDLPEMVRRIEADYPGLSILVTPPLDGHGALAGIVVDRVREAL